MRSFVCLEVTFLNCFVRTILAFEHVSPSMGLLMCFQVVSQREEHSTMIALKGLLSRVNHLVSLELIVLLEDRTTAGIVTLVSTPIVISHVGHQVSLGLEIFSTNVATQLFYLGALEVLGWGLDRATLDWVLLTFIDRLIVFFFSCFGMDQVLVSLDIDTE